MKARGVICISAGYLHTCSNLTSAVVLCCVYAFPRPWTHFGVLWPIVITASVGINDVLCMHKSTIVRLSLFKKIRQSQKITKRKEKRIMKKDWTVRWEVGEECRWGIALWWHDFHLCSAVSALMLWEMSLWAICIFEQWHSWSRHSRSKLEWRGKVFISYTDLRFWLFIHAFTKSTE